MFRTSVTGKFVISGESPVIIPRKQWNAVSAIEVAQLVENPAPYVVVHHSVTPFCNTTEKCSREVRNIQKFHMETQKWDDIGYNFLVSISSDNGCLKEGSDFHCYVLCINICHHVF